MRHLISISLCEIVLFVSASSALGDAATNGPNGINHPGGAFTGDGIGIGQVEPNKPGLPGFDAAGLRDFNGALLNGNGSVIGQLEPLRHRPTLRKSAVQSSRVAKSDR